MNEWTKEFSIALFCHIIILLIRKQGLILITFEFYNLGHASTLINSILMFPHKSSFHIYTLWFLLCKVCVCVCLLAICEDKEKEWKSRGTKCCGFQTEAKNIVRDVKKTVLEIFLKLKKRGKPPSSHVPWPLS